ncbi:sensor histidine kinase [Actinorugispora endophytica]|uniref:Anti-sigma regulatory factor (Ser/Thr protein kinase) n=1 Tax=Actinorugispora endophytica TaxID=1605990 RepID=A0A4R6V0V5_9ACTN|nr:sensor histidine kinase [Actinorugispora endophytica]TDQ52255.1 anti-sigma regulatory factor (Ser/Thr protein kinase) [Actinorugispora endophytica]
MSPTELTTDRDGGAAPFEHLGLLYRTAADYLTGTVPFVRTALSAGDPVLVAAPKANLDLVRSALGSDARRVGFADMTVAGRNPGRILPGVLLDFADSHPERRVSIIGEPVWPGRTDIEYPACVIHEALINTVFAGRDAAILCPYDAQRLSPRALADAHRTHPVMEHLGTRRPSDAYADPLDVAAGFNQPLPAPPPETATAAYRGQASLTDVRRFVTQQAEAAGLAADRTAELTVAVNELVSNTIEHTTGGGSVAAWSERDTFVCQVEDTGHLADPLIGRLRPAGGASRGRGLVFVNHLCDLVRIHTRPGRTAIRLHVLLSASGP